MEFVSLLVIFAELMILMDSVSHAMLDIILLMVLVNVLLMLLLLMEDATPGIMEFVSSAQRTGSSIIMECVFL